ncbi:MAG TPA: outer membrane beta-barrel protein [Acidobacteriota bacterium]|nr:outer membrane beta-barrel protein [Acidobacteriota bacterium]
MWRRSLLCAACLILTTTAAMAQPAAIQRGSVMISGSASITRAGGDLYESDDGAYTTISVTPSVGFFTRDGTMVGGFLSYTRTSREDGASAYVLGLGPTAAFFMNTNSDVVPFVGGGAKIMTIGGSYGGSPDSETGYGFFVSGGVVFLVGSHLGITAETSYNYDRFSAEGSNAVVTGNIIGFAVGVAGFLN